MVQLKSSFYGRVGFLSFIHGLDHAFLMFSSPLLILILRDLDLDYAALGTLVSVAFFTYGIGALSAGFLSDRLGHKWTSTGRTSQPGPFGRPSRILPDLDVSFFLIGLGTGCIIPRRWPSSHISTPGRGLRGLRRGQQFGHGRSPRSSGGIATILHWRAAFLFWGLWDWRRPRSLALFESTGSQQHRTRTPGRPGSDPSGSGFGPHSAHRLPAHRHPGVHLVGHLRLHGHLLAGCPEHDRGGVGDLGRHPVRSRRLGPFGRRIHGRSELQDLAGGYRHNWRFDRLWTDSSPQQCRPAHRHLHLGLFPLRQAAGDEHLARRCRPQEFTGGYTASFSSSPIPSGPWPHVWRAHHRPVQPRPSSSCAAPSPLALSPHPAHALGPHRREASPKLLEDFA